MCGALVLTSWSERTDREDWDLSWVVCTSACCCGSYGSEGNYIDGVRNYNQCIYCSVATDCRGK